MEELTPVAPVTPAPAPVAPTPAAPVVASVPDTSSGGGSGIMESLKALNWIEVGFGVLGVAALFYTIYYYKYNIYSSKKTNTEMQNKIDDLTIKLSDVQSVLEQKEQQQSSTQVFI